MGDPGKEGNLGKPDVGGEKGKVWGWGVGWGAGEHLSLSHCGHPDPLCTLPADCTSSLTSVKGSQHKLKTKDF